MNERGRSVKVEARRQAGSQHRSTDRARRKLDDPAPAILPFFNRGKRKRDWGEDRVIVEVQQQGGGCRRNKRTSGKKRRKKSEWKREESWSYGGEGRKWEGVLASAVTGPLFWAVPVTNRVMHGTPYTQAPARLACTSANNAKFCKYHGNTIPGAWLSRATSGDLAHSRLAIH